MHELINKLAKQADPGFGNEEGDMDESIIGLQAVEKFAKLIVQECAIAGNAAANDDNELRSVYEVIMSKFGMT